jgi:hypothetical protein
MENNGGNRNMIEWEERKYERMGELRRIWDKVKEQLEMGREEDTIIANT